MDKVTRTKSENGTESWTAGRDFDAVGVDVHPLHPRGNRTRCDEVRIWCRNGGPNLDCTLREWAAMTGEGGNRVHAAVCDALGAETARQVSAAVRALLPRPRSYHAGWDTIMPDPGEVESWDCRVCGDACDVKRGVVGRTSSISPHRREHDHFTCPNAGEPWHDRTLKIRIAAADMPAPSVRALMDADADRLVEERG